MHSFNDPLYRSTTFIITALREVQAKVLAELEETGATRHVKSLQMIRLHKAIYAVGMFSIFESILQDRLDSPDGFKAARQILQSQNLTELIQQFDDFYLATNVLKHGKGNSYDKLLARSRSLQFRVKPPDDAFFDEGGVSEITALIDVDEKFVTDCAQLISNISTAIEQERPGTFI